MTTNWKNWMIAAAVAALALGAVPLLDGHREAVRLASGDECAPVEPDPGDDPDTGDTMPLETVKVG